MTLQILTLTSEMFDKRPSSSSIDTIIIHSMYSPDSSDQLSVQACKNSLDAHGVSSHYLIGLDGAIYRCVDEEFRAWHAGESCMPTPHDQRTAVNAFSIGIELIGNEEQDFSDAQYSALIELTNDIMSRRTITSIYGHCDIAPDRKTDPWGFDWTRFLSGLHTDTSSLNTPLSPA